MCLPLPSEFSTILPWIMKLWTVEYSASHFLLSTDIGLQVLFVTSRNCVCCVQGWVGSAQRSSLQHLSLKVTQNSHRYWILVKGDFHPSRDLWKCLKCFFLFFSVFPSSSWLQGLNLSPQACQVNTPPLGYIPTALFILKQGLIKLPNLALNSVCCPGLELVVLLSQPQEQQGFRLVLPGLARDISIFMTEGRGLLLSSRVRDQGCCEYYKHTGSLSSN